MSCVFECLPPASLSTHLTWRLFSSGTGCRWCQRLASCKTVGRPAGNHVPCAAQRAQHFNRFLMVCSQRRQDQTLSSILELAKTLGDAKHLSKKSWIFNTLLDLANKRAEFLSLGAAIKERTVFLRTLMEEVECKPHSNSWEWSSVVTSELVQGLCFVCCYASLSISCPPSFFSVFFLSLAI